MKNPILLNGNNREIIIDFAKKLIMSSKELQKLSAKLDKATKVVRSKVGLAHKRQFCAKEIKTLRDYGFCDHINHLVVIFKRTDGTGPTEWLPSPKTWHPKPFLTADISNKSRRIDSVYDGPLHTAFREWQALDRQVVSFVDSNIAPYVNLVNEATSFHQVVEIFPEVAELEAEVARGATRQVSALTISRVRKVIGERLKR